MYTDREQQYQNGQDSALCQPENKCSPKTIFLLGNSGSGKTQLIRRSHESLGGRLQIIALYSQFNSIYDIERLRAAGVTAIIKTDLLKDSSVKTRSPEDTGYRLFFHELSGNPELYFPVEQEDSFRVILFSITDGEEKLLKHSRLFKEANLVVVNKIDLLPFTDFSLSRFKTQLRKVNPEVPVIKLSCRTGVGLVNWRNWLLSLYGQDELEESGNKPMLNSFPGLSF